MSQISQPQNRRVLIIDDNDAIHSDFRKILAGPAAADATEAAATALFDDAPTAAMQAPFEVDSAMQGKEGLERVQEALKAGRPYAMAFVDGRMPPGWDGVETITRIWEVYPDLQVVLCTAYSDYSWDDLIAKIGQSDRLVILKKPFDTVEALQLANALTAKWALLQQVKSQIDRLEHTVVERSEKLRESEEHFRLIADNVADLTSVVDVDGRYLYTSPSFHKLLSYQTKELQGLCGHDLIHAEDATAAREVWQRSVATGAGQVIEHRIRHKDGTWRSVESHISPVRNPAGAVEHLVVVARDITERRKAEAERQQMEIHLRHAQKMESIGQLAAGIAHEINTPTQYIGDNTRFLKDAFADLAPVLERQRELQQAAKAGLIPAELIERAEQAVQAADVDYLLAEIPAAIGQSLDGVERVTRIVRAMKEFSHPGTTEKTAIDLNRAIESTVTVCRNEWKYVAEVVTEFDASLPLVECLPGEINQTVLNIVVNAAHAIGDVVGDGAKGKGTITVSTRRDGDCAEIRIRDTGSGIPELARAKVFDPFFTTKGVGKGTGQGLAIAHSVVVDKHGGTITFETALGQGTVFIIRLPIRVACNLKEREAA